MSEEEQKTKYPTAGEIRDDLAFTEATLDDNMITQAGLFAHYARLAGDAQYELERAKMRLEIGESNAALKLRDRAEMNGSRITEKMIENQVLSDKKVVALKLELAKSRRNYEGMKSTMEALRHKKDMMIQIGVARRTENEVQARVMERRAETENKVADVKGRAAAIVAKKSG